MTDLLTYAQLSGRAYLRIDQNRTPLPEVPEKWEEVRFIRDDIITGFSAGVYENGDEIVISFTGTNEKLLHDFAVGNIPAALGLGSYQIVQAAALVIDVISKNPGKNISFTGHSLGGGLASVMSVFFDLPATVFDPAPFENSAKNPVALGYLQIYLQLLGYNNSSFNEYTQSLGFIFSEREKNVSSYSLDGEVLEMARDIFPVIAGKENGISIGAPRPISDSVADVAALAVNLHSMTLLESAILSNSFREGMTQQPHAVNIFFDTGLYATDPQTSPIPDFMNLALNTHLTPAGETTPAGTIGWNMLDALGEDLTRIGTTGTVVEASLNKGILAALTEYYRFRTQTNGQFIENTAVSGGIRLDMSAIDSGSDGKGQDRLLNESKS